MNLANLYDYFFCIQNNKPYFRLTKFEIPLSSKDPNLQILSAIISFAVDKLSYIFQNKNFDYTSFNQVIEEVIRLKQNNFVKLKDLFHNENDCLNFVKYTVQANLESAVDDAVFKIFDFNYRNSWFSDEIISLYSSQFKRLFFDTEKYLIKYKSIKTSMLSQIVNLDLLVYKNKKAFSFNDLNKFQNYSCKQ